MGGAEGVAVRGGGVGEAAEADKADRCTSTTRPSPGREQQQHGVALVAAGDGRTWARPTRARAEGAEETTERGQERRAVAVHVRSGELPRAAALGQTARAAEAGAPP